MFVITLGSSVVTIWTRWEVCPNRDNDDDVDHGDDTQLITMIINLITISTPAALKQPRNH